MAKKQNETESATGHVNEPEVPRNPAKGATVSIVFGDRVESAEVIHPWLQLHHVSPEGFVAVVVKINDVETKVPHKTKGEGFPYWIWPEEVQEVKSFA